MNGVIQTIITKDGANGKFNQLTINGTVYGAFGKHYDETRAFKAGDSVDFTFTSKGKYNNLESIKLVTAAPPGAPGSNSSGEFLTKEQGVIVSYAKDLVVSGSFTPDQALDTVFQLIDGVKKRMSGVNPTGQ